MKLLTLKQMQILVFSFFLFIYLIIYAVTTNDKDELIEIRLEQQIKNLENNYKVSSSFFEKLSDNFYAMVLNRKDVLELFYKAKHAKTEPERALIREKLYIITRPYFEQLNKSGVNILLFAFENNKTFLRVHKPDKYGDDLSAVRYSFTYVNENKKSISGFEQGKVSHAFRNIFPLFYGDEYIGSADLSFSSEVLQENMTQVHGIDTHFIVDKSIFDVKVWERQNSVKYIKSLEHKDFLFSLTPSQKDNAFSPDKIELNKSLNDEIAKNIKNNKSNDSFALYKHSGDRVKVMAFLPVKNIKDKKTVAYLVSYSDCYYLESMFNRYMVINIIFFIGLLLLSFAISKNLKQRCHLEIRVNEEVEKNKIQQQTIFQQSRLAQMGEMISMIAHQWRQPLAAISSTSLNLQFQLELDKFDFENKQGREDCKNQFNDSLKDIDNLVQNLTITIDDFRNFYKPNKKPELASFSDVCTQALSVINVALVDNGIEVVCNHKSNEKVELFKNEMMQVVLNILKNASDNFEDKKIAKPKIEITTTKESMTICDNGGGIPEDILEKIFDPYFSTKDEKNGTGLGLYMSKLIVEDHHKAKLLVSNKDDSACFTIKLL